MAQARKTKKPPMQKTIEHFKHRDTPINEHSLTQFIHSFLEKHGLKYEKEGKWFLVPFYFEGLTIAIVITAQVTSYSPFITIRTHRIFNHQLCRDLMGEIFCKWLFSINNVIHFKITFSEPGYIEFITELDVCTWECLEQRLLSKLEAFLETIRDFHPEIIKKHAELNDLEIN